MGEQLDPATRTDLLTSIEEDVGRMTRFLSSLTELTRLESGEIRPTLVPVDLLGAVVDWVEAGKAPDSVTATGDDFPGRSRPLCAYPKHAQYKGQGDTEDAASFECRL